MGMIGRAKAASRIRCWEVKIKVRKEIKEEWMKQERLRPLT